MGGFKFRPYQIDLSDRAIQFVRAKKDYCIALPAQSGKTKTLFRAIVKGCLTVLFVTPRKFITFQGAEEAEENLGADKIAYINSNFKKKDIKAYISNKQVVVMDLQTAYNRASNGYLSGKDFHAIVIDEAHYSMKKSSKDNNKVVDKLKALFPNTPKIYLTATPFDEKGRYLKGLGYIDDRYNPKYMAKNGYLSDVIFYIADVFSRNKSVFDEYKKHLKKNRDGIYTDASIANATNTKAGKILTKKALTYTFAKSIVKVGERVLVYAGSIEQAEWITKEFLVRGHNAKAIHSKVDNPIQIIQDFNNQKFEVLVSVDMLVMGVAVKNVKKSILYRAISSRITYQQLTARGTGGDSKYTAIPNIIYDFTDTYHRMAHPHDFIPFSGDERGKRKPIICQECGCDMAEFPPIVERCGKNKIIKRCIICNTTKEIIMFEKENKKFYEGSFNLVIGGRKADIIEKRNEYKIEKAINIISSILVNRGASNRDVKIISSLIRANIKNKPNDFLNRLIDSAKVSSLKEIVKMIRHNQ